MVICLCRSFHMNLTDSLEGILPSSPEHNIEHINSDLCMQQQGRNLSNDLLKLVYEHEVSKYFCCRTNVEVWPLSCAQLVFQL